MAVGAGSIKRAAKAKPEVKKTVAQKTTDAKKVDTKKKPELTVVKKEINQVCHLTEDLPIHLL